MTRSGTSMGLPNHFACSSLRACLSRVISFGRLSFSYQADGQRRQPSVTAFTSQRSARRPEFSDDEFAKDTKAVEQDLHTLKTLLEQRA
jgi:hypothetical protein